MLYLVRKLEESIIINNDIEIKVVEIKKSSIKFGITFPKNVTVLRKEMHDMIARENISALCPDIESVSRDISENLAFDDVTEENNK